MAARPQAVRRRAATHATAVLGAASLLAASLLAAAPALAAPAATPAASPVGAIGTAGDPDRALQWGLDQVRAEQAWPLSTGAGAVIAVVDTGVDLEHPDLAGRLLPGATFTGCPPVPAGSARVPCGPGDHRGPDGSAAARDGHGTHVAAIAAAAAGDGRGVAGVAPGALVLPVKVAEGGSARAVDVAAGITWAVAHGAQVINLSLGAPSTGSQPRLVGSDAPIEQAVAAARAAGVLTVVAAGNSGGPRCAEPADIPGVVCVGAVTLQESLSPYSQRPVKADDRALVAPGGARGPDGCLGAVWSAVPVGSGSAGCGPVADPARAHAAYTGTSMAAPHVSGVAALLFAQGRTLEQVEAALLTTARQPATGATGVVDPLFGRGIVDAAAAVRAPR